MNNNTFEMVAKTLFGLEDVLARELIELGANDVQMGRRMVSFTGDKELLYKANFHCRTALRILKPIYSFKAKDADTVYNEVKTVNWEEYMSLDKTFAIDSVIYSEDFNHSKFVAYRTKDAIVDYFMEKYEKRPSVRISNPDLYINIHISHNDCTLSIDSSGESLHKRGYRVEQTDAPLNEVLAAGMILKAGWKGDSNFVDPMCGSGTLLIEAAMIALNIAPGLHRRDYAFEKWVDFDQELFDRIYNDEVNEREFTFKCYGSDISESTIEIARKNIRNAGLLKYIDLKVLPFQQYTEAPQPGIVVTNPPYGERISSRDLMGLYTMIGERMKHVFAGYKVWIISYKDECFDQIGLRPSQKMKMINGSLECEYRCYDIFEGKNKEYKKAINEGEESKPYEPRTEPLEFKKRSDDPDKSDDFKKPEERRRPIDFKTERFDRPERRFAAAHSENPEEIYANAPKKRFFGEERADGSPTRKQFGGAVSSDRSSTDRPPRKSFGDRKPAGDGDRDRKPYGGGDRDRKPYGDRDRKPYGDRPARGASAGGGDRKSYSGGGRDKKPFGKPRSTDGGRSFRDNKAPRRGKDEDKE